MSIQINHSVQSLQSVYATQGSLSSLKAKDRLEGVQGKDEVLLSKESQAFSEIFNRLKDGNSKVREDKVAYYTQAIENGTYKVDAKAIADKMLNQQI